MTESEMDARIRRWLAAREPDEVPLTMRDAVAEVPYGEPRSGKRRARYRWPLRILAVAALIGAIGGAALLGGALDHDEVAFEVALYYYTSDGRVKARVPEPTPIHAQLPDGWVSTETGITNEPEEPETPMAVSFWTVGAVFIDPCNQQTRADPPMMQTLDLLAGAFTGWWSPEMREHVWQPIPTQPVNTTVSGFRARYLELRIPATVDMDRCPDGYVTWRNADNAPDNVQRRHAPGDVSRLWIVEVGPDRGTPPNSTPRTSTPLLVIDATSTGEASPEALQELEELIDSIRIDAPKGLP
jgi:hypothetical protein